MPALVPITLHQANAETVTFTITRTVATDDLTLVTSLKLILKQSPCTADTDSTSLTLSSTNPTQIVISSQTTSQITARAYIPATSLVDPYERWWRVDAYIGTSYRTAIYGPVTVVDL